MMREWCYLHTGKALMSIKASFSNIANVLLDWDDVHNDDFFANWRPEESTIHLKYFQGFSREQINWSNS
ncbi:hypothetical protein ACSBR2_033303 [Camellia fascicularis]